MSGAAKKVVPGNADVSIYEIMERCALSEDDERQLQGVRRIEGHDLHQHAVLARGGRSPAAHERAGVQDRLRRVQQLPAAEAHRVIRQADHSQHRHEHDRERRARPSRSSRAPAFRTRCCTPRISIRRRRTWFASARWSSSARRFRSAVIGLSDHTTDNVACLGAVALGASIVERHFTDRHVPRRPRHRLLDGREGVPRAD